MPEWLEEIFLNSPGAALLLQAAISMLAKNIGGKTIRLQSIGYQVTCFSKSPGVRKSESRKVFMAEFSGAGQCSTVRKFFFRTFPLSAFRTIFRSMRKFSFLFVSLFFVVVVDAQVTVRNLLCEYLPNPRSE